MWKNREGIISQIEEKRKSRLICYITSDRPNAQAIIAKDALPVFYNHLRELGEIKKLDVLIFTSGGDTLAAFGLGRLIREFTNWVGILIPHQCLSAGTLFALAANEIYMTELATPSPIDPSITTPLNPVVEGAIPGQRQLLAVSVESVAGFRSLLKEDWGIRGQNSTAEAFKILADRVHPLALGDVYRSRQQIERLARQLLLSHRKDENNIQRIVRTLTRELGSHDYPIYRTEARALMESQIAPEDHNLRDLVWNLFQDFREELQLGIPHNPMTVLANETAAGKSPPISITLKLAVIESSKSRSIFEQKALLSDAVVPGPAGPMRAQQQQVIEARWNHDS